MSTDPSSDVKFEIGHVLFIDIVGYSKLLINEQSEQIQKLKEIVRGAEQVRIAEAEGKLLRLPTGDGGALVFRTNPETPVLCAMEIARELKSHPELRVRMGIHSGPVNEVSDLNEQANIAGAGINNAQRVMDCGDAGHILLSRRVAEDLESYRSWAPHLHSLGECEVKHGVRISLVSLYTDDLGNPELPEKLRLAKIETASAASEASARREEGFWVAVLPFKYSGSSSDLTALAEGLTEEIVTGLSRFSYLKVIARSSTSRYASESVDVRSAGKELGARYVMEGSIRQAGTKLRLAVQLVDAVSGAHLWAENYERTFVPDEIFSLQDDLVLRIVSTVADMHGVLPRSMSEVVRLKAADQMSPYEALLRSFGYNERFTPEDLAEVRTCLERAVQQAPGNAECWAMLSLMYANEYGHWDNAGPDSLDRSLRAARTAVEAAPLHSLPYYALAQALFFKREIPAFRVAAERAISLNPMDGATAAFMGMLIAYAGDWERGCALSDTGCQLNPNHPGWYRYPAWHDAYRKKEYRKALDVALRLNAPQNYYTHAVLAICYAQLGRMEEARKALGDMLTLKPNYAEVARELHGRWIDPDLVEQLMDGLRKAGLEIPDNGSSDSPKRSEARPSIAEPAKSVAVLPFVNLSSNKDDEYLSDGMTEELINALAKIPGLRVPGRTSCFAFKGKSEADIFRKVGDQLHVDTVLEGSVRKAGDKLRVTAQLINVSDGYHLWSKNYDGDVKDILTFQSNVAEQVVQALQVHLGVEAARALLKKPTENPEAHRLYLLGRYEFAKYTQAGWNNAIRYYEQALKLDPEYALAYCGLADNYAYMGSTVMPGKEANTKVEQFARKALALDSELAEAHMSLALALVAAYDWRSGLKEFDRALELNPNLAFAYELQAWTLNGLGRFDEAIAKDKKAIELDPLNPFFQMALSFFLYWARQHDDAIAQARKTLEMDPNSAISHVLLGLSFLKKGDTAGAIPEFQKAKEPNPGAWYQGYLGYAYAISGDRAKAEQALRELEELARQQYVSPTAFATIYLGLGQNEKCLDWLEKSYKQQDSACWYLKIDQIYDNVRTESRFQALVQKVFGETQ
jgi:TolB-like protein/Tfp pilus assembly protein PilF